MDNNDWVGWAIGTAVAAIASGIVVYAVMQPRQKQLEQRVNILEYQVQTIHGELVHWRDYCRDIERRMNQQEAQIDSIVSELESIRAQVHEHSECYKVLNDLLTKAKAKVAQKQRYNTNQQRQDHNHVPYIF